MDLELILRTAVERGASDIHLKAGQPPVIRFDGELEPLEGFAIFDSVALEQVLNRSALRRRGASPPSTRRASSTPPSMSPDCLASA